jgi:uncharacterized membrane protein (DUF485 family)
MGLGKSKTRKIWRVESASTTGYLETTSRVMELSLNMADLHSPPPSEEASDLKVERYNARLGLLLFAIYLAAYSAFVAINAFWPGVMDEVLFLGLNLAVVWGLALIVGAFLLALVYAWCCKRPGTEPP